MDDSPFPLSPTDIERQIMEYEAFKLETYVTSGVFPKRYFGYLDGRWRTAADEMRLRNTISAAVSVVNTWQKEHGDSLTINAAEVAVTFLAESGAIYMRGPSEKLDRLHPVFDVGLDDVASGLADLAALRTRIDKELGTNMDGLVAWVEPGATVLPVPSSVPDHERWLINRHNLARGFNEDCAYDDEAPIRP